MGFTSCNYNNSLYNFTTHKQESCLGLLGSSELLVVNWTLVRTGTELSVASLLYPRGQLNIGHHFE
jgi:hypothetical protein